MRNLKKIFGNFGRTNLSMEGSGHAEHSHQHEEHSQQDTKYQCPMKCEGEKVYDEPGNCPVCNMKLVPVKKED